MLLSPRTCHLRARGLNTMHVRTAPFLLTLVGFGVVNFKRSRRTWRTRACLGRLWLQCCASGHSTVPVHAMLDAPFAARSCDCGCGTAHEASLLLGEPLTRAGLLHALGNERHLALRCPSFDTLRDDYATKLEFETDFYAFMQQPSGVLASYVYCLLRRRQAYLGGP